MFKIIKSTTSTVCTGLSVVDLLTETAAIYATDLRDEAVFDTDINRYDRDIRRQQHREEAKKLGIDLS